MNTNTKQPNKETEKVTEISSISQIQLITIKNLIGEFMADVMLEKSKNKEQFDTSYVQPNLKLNQ